MTRSTPRERSLARPIAVRGLLAFLVCLVGFGVLAWRVGQPGIPPIDSASTNLLHGLASPTLDALMAAVTGLGSSVVLASITGLAAVLLAIRRRRAEAVFVSLALVGTLVLNETLKAVFQRPRPGFAWAEVLADFGFPSGHAMNAFVVYLALALVAWRLGGRRVGTVALALAVILAVSVGVSRIYLGAHWLTDVVGGYLAGALWMLCLVAASAGVSRLRRSRRPDAAARDEVTGAGGGT
jgi:undecaprenyl-diphosphatase